MDSSVYKFILRHSKREQLVLLAMTALSLPFYYFSLDLPKQIINDALGAKPGFTFPADFFGTELEQLPYLFVLSGIFLVLVCVNGGFKYFINVYRGRLGERLLRRLRYELYARVLRFPLPHFKKVSQGEVIPMITAEVEPLGGFAGDAFSLPAFQGGQLLTLMAFMFVQDWTLGLAAIALYPFQMYVIPKLQAKVNALGKQRVKRVRVLSDRIGESISGVQEVHANDLSRLMLARFSARLGEIYDIRFEIYRRKFFIKFLNNFLAQVTPFLFYSIGGYLAITGHLSLGALVAVLAAYKDVAAPWKELLNYYQRQADARIKYGQVVEQFDPPGSLDEKLQLADPEAELSFEEGIRASNAGLDDEEGTSLISGASLKVAKGEKLALFGPSGGGNDALAVLLARLQLPSSGQILVGERDLATVEEAVTGRAIGYVAANSFVFSTSIRENLLLGSMHRPLQEPSYSEEEQAGWKDRRTSAELSGNSVENEQADWTDYQAIGADNGAALSKRLVEVLEVVDLTDDCYQLGLRGTIDPSKRSETAERFLTARKAFAEKLASDPKLANLIELFDVDSYNNNATVAENLLFGTPVGATFNLDTIAAQPYVREVLDKVDLTRRFVEVGRELASTMVELFADLPSDHEFFSQFSFISPDDLPEFQILLGRADRLGVDALSAEDYGRFLSLPFKLAPARHRLGLIDDEIRGLILDARKMFRAELPEELAGSVAFFSAETYNAAASVQDNILFGKIAYGQADANARIGKILAEVLQSLGLTDEVVETGLEFQVGIAGSRLSTAQRQKVALARVILRRPEVLLVNDAIAGLDASAQRRVMGRVLSEMKDRTVICVTQMAEMARVFDRIAFVRDGRVAEDGPTHDLDKEGTAFHAFVNEA